ncbi:MAG: beta-lactamase family protein [Oscillibacter sp.]|jgi:CubicO group peptidase (beta-lactamase class C family)|nr:beta-lactamase family protein [Oscillibacter sp.]
MNQKKLDALGETVRSTYDNITGIVVRKNGAVCWEHYYNNYTANQALHVFSVTKSVLSILIGIALDQGLLKSVDQRVLDFFPDYEVKTGETTIQKITIRHLLTMTAPYKYDIEPYQQFFTSANPIQDALDLLGGDKPIGTFHYAAIGGPQILSGILVRAVGQPILDFAEENLFAPLGIRVPGSLTLHSEAEHFAVMNNPNTRGWVIDPQGFHTAGWGLFLTPAEMAKLGQLYLNGGGWEGRQIVSAEWIAQSTAMHSLWAEASLPYGYLWWLTGGKRFAAIGDGGNVIYVNPERQLVVAVAALFKPNVTDRIPWIQQQFEPLFDD